MLFRSRAGIAVLVKFDRWALQNRKHENVLSIMAKIRSEALHFGILGGQPVQTNVYSIDLERELARLAEICGYSVSCAHCGAFNICTEIAFSNIPGLGKVRDRNGGLPDRGANWDKKLKRQSHRYPERLCVNSMYSVSAMSPLMNVGKQPKSTSVSMS